MERKPISIYDVKNFALAIVLFAVIIIFIVFRGRIGPAVNYLRVNKGVTKGIVVFSVSAVLFALAALAFADERRAIWFEDAYVYLGVDRTFDVSPMCEQTGEDSRATSNGGVRGSIFTIGEVRVGYRYTHHSCAFNPDRENYDAIGGELSIRLW